MGHPDHGPGPDGGRRRKARSRTLSRTRSQPPLAKRATPSEVTEPLAVTNQLSLPTKDRNQPSKNRGDKQLPAEPWELSWAKRPPLLSLSSNVPSATLRSAPQAAKNSDTNTLHQLHAEIEVKLRALDARLRHEIETACASVQQEFRGLLSQTASVLKDTCYSTVATLHALTVYGFRSIFR